MIKGVGDNSPMVNWLWKCRNNLEHYCLRPINWVQGLTYLGLPFLGVESLDHAQVISRSSHVKSTEKNQFVVKGLKMRRLLGVVFVKMLL